MQTSKKYLIWYEIETVTMQTNRKQVIKVI